MAFLPPHRKQPANRRVNYRYYRCNKRGFGVLYGERGKDLASINH